MTRERLFLAFFFAAFAFLLWQLLSVFSLFLPAFLWASTLTLVFYPIYPPLRRRMPKDLAALAAASLVLVGVLLPLGLLLFVLAKESAAIYPAARAWLVEVRSGDPATLLPAPLRSLWENLDEALSPAGIDLQNLLLLNINEISLAIRSAVSQAGRETLILLFDSAVLALSLFFFFRNGEDLLAWFLELVPMPAAHKKAVARSLLETFVLLVRGIMANAVFQGILAGVGFWAAGLRFPVLFGCACGFASLLPPFGAALVWLPTSLRLISLGQRSGLFLLAWGLLAITLLDRLVRPALAGKPKRSRLGGLLLFFGILGGLRVYGPDGLLLGPLLMTSAFAFIRIYREKFHRAP